ncbi:MAG: hypothetical protein QG626_552 [Patescibacteria group bacterium]|jgi:hypothetical protein|nr:hypothetical protein [Patescibacteria group bacterium]
MRIFWFSDEEGAFWNVIAAKSEERAWELLAAQQEKTVEQLKTDTELNAVTEIGDREGRIATIYPHEVYFAIRDGFGSENLGHRRNI